jgi:hypothetical protein
MQKKTATATAINAAYFLIVATPYADFCPHHIFGFRDVQLKNRAPG